MGRAQCWGVPWLSEPHEHWGVRRGKPIQAEAGGPHIAMQQLRGLLCGDELQCRPQQCMSRGIAAPLHKSAT